MDSTFASKLPDPAKEPLVYGKLQDYLWDMSAEFAEIFEAAPALPRPLKTYYGESMDAKIEPRPYRFITLEKILLEAKVMAPLQLLTENDEMTRYVRILVRLRIMFLKGSEFANIHEILANQYAFRLHCIQNFSLFCTTAVAVGMFLYGTDPAHGSLITLISALVAIIVAALNSFASFEAYESRADGSRRASQGFHRLAQSIKSAITAVHPSVGTSLEADLHLPTSKAGVDIFWEVCHSYTCGLISGPLSLDAKKVLAAASLSLLPSEITAALYAASLLVEKGPELLASIDTCVQQLAAVQISRPQLPGSNGQGNFPSSDVSFAWLRDVPKDAKLNITSVLDKMLPQELTQVLMGMKIVLVHPALDRELLLVIPCCHVIREALPRITPGHTLHTHEDVKDHFTGNWQRLVKLVVDDLNLNEYVYAIMTTQRLLFKSVTTATATPTNSEDLTAGKETTDGRRPSFFRRSLLASSVESSTASTYRGPLKYQSTILFIRKFVKSEPSDPKSLLMLANVPDETLQLLRDKTILKKTLIDVLPKTAGDTMALSDDDVKGYLACFLLQLEKLSNFTHLTGPPMGVIYLASLLLSLLHQFLKSNLQDNKGNSVLSSPVLLIMSFLDTTVGGLSPASSSSSSSSSGDWVSTAGAKPSKAHSTTMTTEMRLALLQILIPVLPLRIRQLINLPRIILESGLSPADFRDPVKVQKIMTSRYGAGARFRASIAHLMSQNIAGERKMFGLAVKGIAEKAELLSSSTVVANVLLKADSNKVFTEENLANLLRDGEVARALKVIGEYLLPYIPHKFMDNLAVLQSMRKRLEEKTAATKIEALMRDPVHLFSLLSKEEEEEEEGAEGAAGGGRVEASIEHADRRGVLPRRRITRRMSGIVNTVGDKGLKLSALETVLIDFFMSHVPANTIRTFDSITNILQDLQDMYILLQDIGQVANHAVKTVDNIVKWQPHVPYLKAHEKLEGVIERIDQMLKDLDDYYSGKAAKPALMGLEIDRQISREVDSLYSFLTEDIPKMMQAHVEALGRASSSQSKWTSRLIKIPHQIIEDLIGDIHTALGVYQLMIADYEATLSGNSTERKITESIKSSPAIKAARPTLLNLLKVLRDMLDVPYELQKRLGHASHALKDIMEGLYRIIHIDTTPLDEDSERYLENIIEDEGGELAVRGIDTRQFAIYRQELRKLHECQVHLHRLVRYVGATKTQLKGILSVREKGIIRDKRIGDERLLTMKGGRSIEETQGILQTARQQCQLLSAAEGAFTQLFEGFCFPVLGALAFPRACIYWLEIDNFDDELGYFDEKQWKWYDQIDDDEGDDAAATAVDANNGRRGDHEQGGGSYLSSRVRVKIRKEDIGRTIEVTGARSFFASMLKAMPNVKPWIKLKVNSSEGFMQMVADETLDENFIQAFDSAAKIPSLLISFFSKYQREMHDVLRLTTPSDQMKALGRLCLGSIEMTSKSPSTAPTFDDDLARFKRDLLKAGHALLPNDAKETIKAGALLLANTSAVELGDPELLLSRFLEHDGPLHGLTNAVRSYLFDMLPTEAKNVVRIVGALKRTVRANQQLVQMDPSQAPRVLLPSDLKSPPLVLEKFMKNAESFPDEVLIALSGSGMGAAAQAKKALSPKDAMEDIRKDPLGAILNRGGGAAMMTLGKKASDAFNDPEKSQGAVNSRMSVNLKLQILLRRTSEYSMLHLLWGQQLDNINSVLGFLSILLSILTSLVLFSGDERGIGAYLASSATLINSINHVFRFAEAMTENYRVSRSYKSIAQKCTYYLLIDINAQEQQYLILATEFYNTKVSAPFVPPPKSLKYFFKDERQQKMFTVIEDDSVELRDYVEFLPIYMRPLAVPLANFIDGSYQKLLSVFCYKPAPDPVITVAEEEAKKAYVHREFGDTSPRLDEALSTPFDDDFVLKEHFIEGSIFSELQDIQLVDRTDTIEATFNSAVQAMPVIPRPLDQEKYKFITIRALMHEPRMMAHAKDAMGSDMKYDSFQSERRLKLLHTIYCKSSEYALVHKSLGRRLKARLIQINVLCVILSSLVTIMLLVSTPEWQSEARIASSVCGALVSGAITWINFADYGGRSAGHEVSFKRFAGVCTSIESIFIPLKDISSTKSREVLLGTLDDIAEEGDLEEEEFADTVDSSDIDDTSGDGNQEFYEDMDESGDSDTQ